mmetsp:Transcript_24740/g.56924  ORF Transcript_24740/g.56924 Transcript_24740/m.56924 type:complete len:270 (-) Transcript_24740:227-1036(-)
MNVGDHFVPDGWDSIVGVHFLVGFIPTDRRVMRENARVPAPFECFWPAVKAFRTLIKQHIARFEHHFIRVPLKILDDDGPWFRIFAVVDMQNGGNDMCYGSVDMHQQIGVVTIHTQPVRNFFYEGHSRPLLVHGTECAQNLTVESIVVDEERRRRVSKLFDNVDVDLLARTVCQSVVQSLHELPADRLRTPREPPSCAGPKEIRSMKDARSHRERAAADLPFSVKFCATRALVTVARKMLYRSWSDGTVETSCSNRRSIRARHPGVSGT